MKKKFVTYLIKNHLTLSCYESFTGGNFANLITDVPGSSKIFLGGIVVYSIMAKLEVGRINDNIIKKFGPISAETAEAMLDACGTKFDSDIVVSFTGNAGPDQIGTINAGTIFIGIKINNVNHIFCQNLSWNFSRKKIKTLACNYAMEKILLLIKKNKGKK